MSIIGSIIIAVGIVYILFLIKMVNDLDLIRRSKEFGFTEIGGFVIFSILLIAIIFYTAFLFILNI